MYAITSLSKQLSDIKQELASIKEIMVAIALHNSEVQLCLREDSRAAITRSR
jgi:regulator of replication initiation timing